MERAGRKNLTAGRVESFKCPQGKAQAFLWDAKAPGLALRATPAGAKAYVFQSRLRDGATVRITIGDPQSWTIPRAQEEARRLQTLIDRGRDPRAERAAIVAKEAADLADAKAERQRRELLGLDAWREYVKSRTPHWGERHLHDHQALAQAGGKPRKRSRVPVTAPGPLYALLDRPLADIDAAAVDKWITRETKVRPTRAALAFRLLRAFVNWCVEHDDYRLIVQAGVCSQKRVRERVVYPKARADVLQREQLAPWFTEVRKLTPVPAAYLQALLLTGARREELMRLRWTDVDFQWKALRIRDKVEGERTIPLTPYVAQLLAFLPRRNQWVFSSPLSAGGRLQDPRAAHGRALKAAGLPHLTMHGLRRSFGSLAEWVECPVGIVAQIQGHKPSALAEKHYRVRPLDLLRAWHEKIEAWILGEAGIEQPALPAHPLRAVAGA